MSTVSDLGPPCLEAEDIVNLAGIGKFQWGILFQCGFPLLADAMEILLLTFIMDPVAEEFGASPLQMSFLNSCIFAGMFAGASLFGLISDTFGRRVAFGLLPFTPI
eukprot:PhM_4_TR17389/c1_g1_i1/m.33023